MTRNIRAIPLRIRIAMVRKWISLLEIEVENERILADKFTEESLKRRKRKGEKVYDGSPRTSEIDKRMILALDEKKRLEKKVSKKKIGLTQLKKKLYSR